MIGKAVEFIKVIAGMLVVPLVGLSPVIPAGCVALQAIVTAGVLDEIVTGALTLLEQIV